MAVLAASAPVVVPVERATKRAAAVAVFNRSLIRIITPWDVAEGSFARIGFNSQSSAGMHYHQAIIDTHGTQNNPFGVKASTVRAHYQFPELLALGKIRYFRQYSVRRP
ncbi:hypothetical protein [Streptacidiphilus sp. EB129]|uniref:hypothetical protein n=1 Tax=Streptacidiphilus sp. EB129 TaxID=3156262 RepID=UPI003515981B